MKVKVYVINEGQASQYFGLMTERGNILHSAPNNWKTKKGAENWAKKHNFEIA